MRYASFLISTVAASALAFSPFAAAQTQNIASVFPDDSAPAPATNAVPPDNNPVVIEPAEYRSITMQQRFDWWARSSFGPQTLAAGLVTSAIRTGLDHPPDYGPHWEGYGDRLAVREAGVIVSGAIEVSVGSIWGEDPRYPRAGTTERFTGRLGRVVKYTVMSRNRNGNAMPAYARLIGMTGSSFLSNEWRVPSEDTTSAAVGRVGTAFLSKMASNAFKEFMPDLTKKFFHHSTP